MAIGFRTSGMFGRPPMQAPQPGTMPIGVEQMQQKPGFFQRSGVKTAAGILGDTLLTLGGGEPMYAPMMQQRKLQEEDARIRQQMFEQKRIAERKDMQWEWQNKPREERAPYRWKANDGSLMELGPDGQRRQVYKDPTPKTTYISVDNSDGTKTVVPVVNGQIMGGGQRPQIGAVVADPRKQGGQAAPPPATFRGGL